MPNYSKKIVYLSKAQYQELIANNSVTVNGVTVTYNENDIYVTPQAEPITDVKINNTSIGNNGIANIPVANSSALGVSKINNSYGVDISANGELMVKPAGNYSLKTGQNSFNPITPDKQHLSVFYGLATAAGDSSQSSSVNEIGIYTDTAKQKIQNMLGITDLIGIEESTTATAAHSQNSIFLMGGKLYKATTDIVIGDAVASGTNCVPTTIDETFLKDSDKILIIHVTKESNSAVCDTTIGVIGEAIQQNKTILCCTDRQSSFSNVSSNTFIFKLVNYYINSSTGNITAAQFGNEFITTINSKNYFVKSAITFNGTAIEWGDTFYLIPANTSDLTNDSNFYSKPSGGIPATDLASGVVPDIQVNGTSIVSSGIANIPIATNATAGVMKVSSTFGLSVDSYDRIIVNKATDEQIKPGNNLYASIVPANQHVSAFYALAKAAGDSTQSVSDNAVGTYTESAKTAIRGMLGIDGSAALVENVSGTTPSITGQPNVRYICGEVSTLSVTPPSCGSVEVIFSSGSTATALTVPNTVKWPAWFDATTLETNVIYDIIITDATYGAVMTWAS